MSALMQMRAIVAAVVLISLGSLAYVYAFPPPSMRVSRDGVPHFTPPTIHPETGEVLDVNRLVRRFKGLER